jgi:molecular chaperone GrpE
MSQNDALPESALIKPDEPENSNSENIQETPEPKAEPGLVEPLAEQLAEASRKAEENWDKFVRAQAELENLKRRTEKDVQNAHKFALERFAKELITVVDSLELGLQAASGDNPETQKLREGMELTLKQLLTVLERFNICGIDPVGEKFNPELHQAMAMQPTDTAAPNTVVKVFQKGYLLNDRLLRPAMVVIAQAPAQQASPINEQA